MVRIDRQWVPQVIANYHCLIGEGPLWHASEERLYWVDIGTGRMFRYDPKTGAHERFYHAEPVGGFTIQADGSLLLFMSRGAVKIWKDNSLITVINEIPSARESRFNDVIADPVGRVFCGIMPSGKKPGCLYRLEKDGTLIMVLNEVGIPNGMGFTLDRKKLYFADSTAHKVYLFDYNEKNGQLSNQPVFADIRKGVAEPDGMTVDAEDHVWVVLVRGWSMVRYTPEGELERTIRFPARFVTSLTFGGPDYTDIYVTSGRDPSKKGDGTDAGALFHLNLGIKGVPEFASRVLI